MDSKLTSSLVTGAGKLLPAEVRVLLKIRKSLALSTELASESNGLIDHCYKILLANRQGGQGEAKENFNLFISNVGFVRALRLFDPEDPNFPRQRNQAVREISREFRKTLGTESLKLAEAIGTLQIPSQVLQAFAVFKALATPETKNSLLTEMRETSTKAETVNLAASLIGEKQSADALIRGLYPDDYVLISAASRIYGMLVFNGFKLGLKSLH